MKTTYATTEQITHLRQAYLLHILSCQDLRSQVMHIPMKHDSVDYSEYTKQLYPLNIRDFCSVLFNNETYFVLNRLSQRGLYVPAIYQSDPETLVVLTEPDSAGNVYCIDRDNSSEKISLFTSDKDSAKLNYPKKEGIFLDDVCTLLGIPSIEWWED